MAEATRRCSINDCNRKVKARGWCNRHYIRWSTYGDPLAGGKDRVRCHGSLIERLWTKIERAESGCWLWTGAKSDLGYGLFHDDGHMHGPHRLLYSLLIEPVPDELHMDHLCRTPSCVNPSHLEPVTPRVNVLRGNAIAGRSARRQAGLPEYV